MTSLAGLSRELEALVARTLPSVVAVQHARGQGSGVAFTPDGYVLTNAHVVSDAKHVRVALTDGEPRRARLVGVDTRTDIGVVHVDARLDALPLAAGPPRVGQLVVAMGNPLRFDRSVSLGVVSATHRSLRAPDGGSLEGLVQTDAAINPGNSGGPLVDTDGAVVGINTAIVPRAQGIGFAVPAATATWVASVLLRKGTVDRPLLGVHARGEALDTEDVARTGQPRGVRVLKVEEGAARRAGLRAHDLLLQANGAELTTVDDLQRVLVLAEGEVELAFLRGEARRVVTVAPERRAA